jgi:hypothetical protein
VGLSLLAPSPQAVRDKLEHGGGRAARLQKPCHTAAEQVKCGCERLRGTAEGCGTEVLDLLCGATNVTVL